MKAGVRRQPFVRAKGAGGGGVGSLDFTFNQRRVSLSEAKTERRVCPI